jgi:hypothetical protein
MAAVSEHIDNAVKIITATAGIIVSQNDLLE